MRTLITLLFITALCTCVSAQMTVTGCVFDEAAGPLVGVTVLLKGTETGTVTDIDGCFSLKVPTDSADLVLSYVGYTHIEKQVAEEDSKDLRFFLVPDASSLDEVVVIGYGSAARRELRSSDDVAYEYEPVLSPDAYEVGYKKVVTGVESIAGTAGGVAAPGGAAPVPGPAAGQLTAGETNDFGKWEMWQDISKEDLAEFRDTWHFYPDHRYATQLIFPNGKPATDVPVRLLDKAGNTIWAARTDNRGRAELWAGMNEPAVNEQARYHLVAEAEGRLFTLRNAKTFREGINTLELPLGCERRSAVDIAFVVDATGSMGDEIRYLRSELADVIGRAQTQLSAASLRTAAVFYRDSSDAYVTVHNGFTEKATATVDYVGAQSHAGGGDHPEAVDAALLTAVDSLAWSANAAARLLFLVLDAPPHQDQASVRRIREATRRAAEKGIRLIPVVCSGMTKDGEYLLRSLALATNGTYVFLTDDSGIGGKHLAPTTDSYDVEKLNDLMVRLIGQFGKSEDCGAAASLDDLKENPRRKGELKLKTFPNPTPGPVTVKLPRGKGTLDVVDMNGKLLRRVTVSGRRVELELEGFAAGTYILRFTDGDDSGTVRVVVTR